MVLSRGSLEVERPPPKHRVDNMPTKRRIKRKIVAEAADEEESDGPVPSPKRARRLCSIDGCKNGVVKGGVCVKHGAAVAPRKKCSHDGCSNNAQKGGKCIRHGAEVKECSHDGCTNIVVKGGIC